MAGLRVVIDTSSLISYLLTKGSIMRQVIQTWEEEEYQLLLSPRTYRELLEVLSRPTIAQRTGEAREWLLERINKAAVFVPGKLEINGVCRDPKDDKFLACAVEGWADYLVSSDKDLLDLRTYDDLCILNPGQFLVALQLARLSEEEIRRRFGREALQTFQSQLCLDAATEAKLIRVLMD
jgi:putative PIN family toxin of toxin-antitoxin system